MKLRLGLSALCLVISGASFAQTAPKGQPAPMPAPVPPASRPAPAPAATTGLDGDAVCHVASVLVSDDLAKSQEKDEKLQRVAILLERNSEFYYGKVLARYTPDQAAGAFLAAVRFLSGDSKKQVDVALECAKKKSEMDKVLTANLRAINDANAKKK